MIGNSKIEALEKQLLEVQKQLSEQLSLTEKHTLALYNKEKKVASLEKTVEKQQTYFEELIKKYILRKKELSDHPNQLKFEFFEQLLNDLVETSAANEDDREEEPKPELKSKTIKSSKE